MLGVRESTIEPLNESLGEVLIEEQSHATTSLRSRSAAKARQARISAHVNSGKSRSIASSVMPEARYSKTSVTVILIPRMQGLPLRLPASRVMIFE